MPGNQFIPPVQPISMAPSSFGGPVKPAGKTVKTPDSTIILMSAVIDALIAKNLITEEDVFQAIDRYSKPEPQAAGPVANKPEGAGYPGAADTQKGMGAEAGKMSPNRN